MQPLTFPPTLVARKNLIIWRIGSYTHASQTNH